MDTTTLVGQNTTNTLTNKTITGATNLVDASALQTTGTAVNVSLAAPLTMGKVLTVTSATTATWQDPIAQITTPATTEVNKLVLWGDNTGDTLASASIKMSGTIFTNTSDQNLITVGLGSSNIGVGLNTVTSITTGINNIVLGDSAGDALTSGSYNTSCGINSLGSHTTGSQNICIGALAGSSDTSSESGNICIGYNVTGTAGESSVICIGNRAMYKSTGGNCSFGFAPIATGTVNSAFGSSVLATLTTGASNTAMGWSAMPAAITGGTNCALGYAAPASLTTGNIAIGFGTGSNYTTSESDNIVIGTSVSGTGAYRRNLWGHYC
jgi:hypothetical protein